MANVVPDFATLIRSSRTLDDVRKTHQAIASSGKLKQRLLGNLLVQMYGRRGSLQDARQVFDQIENKNVYSWSLIIGACVENSEFREALWHLWSMDQEGVKPDSVLFVSVLTACSELQLLLEGRKIHQRIAAGVLETGNVLTILVKLYSRCGSVEEARKVFDQMKFRDLLAWNTMISAYAKNGHCLEAVHLLQKMDCEGLKADEIVFSSLLDSICSGEIQVGREIHSRVVASGIDRDIILQTSILNMYGRSGCVEEARKMFNSMALQDVAAWTSMIAAYAQHGHPEKALELFSGMESAKLAPDKFSFSIILSACGHAGLVEEGKFFFESMVSRYGIHPSIRHCVCVLDLLGRAGRLDEAERFLRAQSADHRADGRLWRAVLASCVLHGDIDRGEQIARQAVLVDPGNNANYVLLSSMYKGEARAFQA